MKRVSVIILFLIPAFFVSGQNNYFKNKSKNPAGTCNPDISFIKIGPGNITKSVPGSKLSFFPDLTSMPFNNSKYVNMIIRENGAPVYIEKEINSSKSSGAATFEERFFRFMEEMRSVTGIKSPKEEFRISGIVTDELGVTHIKSVQKYKTIDIYGSESSMHIDNKTERFTGSLHVINNEVKTTPQFSIESALKKAAEDLGQKTIVKELNRKEKDILRYDSPEYALVMYDKGNNEYVLTWEITIRPNFIEVWKYFINASDGVIIHCYNKTCSDGPVTATALDLNNIQRTIDSYLDNGTYYLMNVSESMYNQTSGEGVILTLDAKNTSTSTLDYSYVTSLNNTWTNKSAVSAHYNATRTYDYFMNTFGQNSVNGQGGNIISLINVAEDDGSSMENAFWNGQAAFYGNGGTNFKPLAGALDVTAHELGHGVVSNTANLEYYGQPGAINESYADIFGSMVDRDDWLIGEDITKTAFSPSGALRNMADPHNMGSRGNDYWQPKHVSEMYLGSEDNGGVHINSGIGNYVYYLYATAVTKDKAEKVFFRALKNYLTKTSQFIDFRIAVIQSASDLYGANSQEVAKAKESFTSAGIYEEVQVDKTQDYSINPGQEYLLSYDTDNADPNTLYLCQVPVTTSTIFTGISTTDMKSKVSVTDDGASAVFVSSDSKIRYISLNPLKQETILSDQAFWDNVAISKDGRRLAAISTEVDTSIYVYDFASKKWAKFLLYNPTTSQFNTNAGGVLYADAIEFDITGENLIYDGCNILNSSTTNDIYYWDIGFINVWNNSKNTFGDGSISKLFGSLPENISIGNAVFSRNSPSVIAFDYVDNDSEEYAVLGTDITTGETGLITSNATIGYPSFSKNDDRIAFSALTSANAEVVATINLSQNKISGTGSVTPLINKAKWPVYYATGARQLGLSPVSDFTVDYKTGSAPLEVKFLDLSANDPTSWQWTFEGGSPATSALQNPPVNYTKPGTYKVTLTTRNNFGTNTNTRDAYIAVTTATGINDTESNLFRFYPNPVNDILNISCEKDFSFRLLSIYGNPLLTGKNCRQIDLSGTRPGVYVLEIKVEDILFKRKLIKK